MENLNMHRMWTQYGPVLVTNPCIHLFSWNNEQALGLVKGTSCTSLPLFPKVTAEKILQAYPHDLHGSKETSALFKRPIPFLIHFSGPTSGYPQTPIGNKNSLNYGDCSLFLFLQAITSVLHCSVKQQALLKKNSLDVIQSNGSELFGHSSLQICQMFNSGSS